MAKMKTLTVSGQTYTVNDPEAVSFAQTQALTHLQQQTARENIGACTFAQTADRLCPSFSEADTVVRCEPVEGYPLAAVSSIVPRQSGSGDPSPDNVRPISGHTALKLTRCGKNLARYPYTDTTKTVNGITFTDNGDGTVTANGTATANAVFDLGIERAWALKPGAEYTASIKQVSGTVTGTPSFVVNYYKPGASGGSYSGWMNANISKAVTKPCPSDYSSVRAYILISSGAVCTNLVLACQLEAGSTATDYEPYREPTTFAMDLGQTVYGGCLDWATGVLTITDKGMALAGFTWTQSNHINTNGFFRASLPDSKVGTALGQPCICNMFSRVTEFKDVEGIYKGENSAIAVGSNYILGTSTIAIGNARGQTLEEFKAELTEKEAFLVYRLAEPITIQLTPQKILALSGVNTLYSDTGDTCVTGKADPSAIIERLTNAIIALGGNI